VRSSLTTQSIGSGVGQRAGSRHTSTSEHPDAFLLDSEITARRPTACRSRSRSLRAVVVATTLKGLSAPLKMTADIVAGIFDGKITSGTTAAIAARQRGSHPPASDIASYTGDGSGTTSIFTTYLTKASPDWVTTVGKGDATHSRPARRSSGRRAWGASGNRA